MTFPHPQHLILTSIGCVACKHLEAYLIGQKTTTWKWIYHHIKPDLFDALHITSTPTVITQVGQNEYRIVAIGLQEAIDYHRKWRLPSSIITGGEEE